MKLVIYARISSEKQSENSIEAQLSVCRQWAEQHGHEVVRTYVDHGFSAKTAKRDAFQQMVKAVLAGQADAILVHKLDRFSRNREDSITYKAMLRRRGKQVISVSEPLGDSPTDRLLEGVLETLNEFYLLNLAAETQKGLRNLAEKGIFPMRPPVGYYKKNKLCYVDPVKGPLIAEAFREYATGNYTLSEWAAEVYRRGKLRTKGGNKIQKGYWSKIFHNPFYVGKFWWNDAVWNGIHEPLTDEVTWNRVQELLAERRPAAKLGERHRYLLTGYLVSAVHGTRMNGNTVRNAQGSKFYYYRAVGVGAEHNIDEREALNGLTNELKKVRVSDGQIVPLGDVLRLAVQVAESVGHVFEQLENDELRSELLSAVLPADAVFVEADGKMTLKKVNDGFEIKQELKNEQNQDEN